MLIRHVLLGLLVLLIAGVVPEPADAQVRDRLRDSVRRILTSDRDPREMTVDEIVEHGTRCVYDDATCIDRAKKEDEILVLTDARGEVLMTDEDRPIQDPDQISSQQRAELLRQAFAPEEDVGDAAREHMGGASPDERELAIWSRSCQSTAPAAEIPRDRGEAVCSCLVDDAARSIAAGEMGSGFTDRDRASLALNFWQTYQRTRFAEDPGPFRLCMRPARPRP